MSNLSVTNNITPLLSPRIVPAQCGKDILKHQKTIIRGKNHLYKLQVKCCSEKSEMGLFWDLSVHALGHKRNEYKS